MSKDKPEPSLLSFSSMIVVIYAAMEGLTWLAKSPTLPILKWGSILKCYDAGAFSRLVHLQIFKALKTTQPWYFLLSFLVSLPQKKERRKSVLTFSCGWWYPRNLHISDTAPSPVSLCSFSITPVHGPRRVRILLCPSRTSPTHML